MLVGVRLILKLMLRVYAVPPVTDPILTSKRVVLNDVGVPGEIYGSGNMASASAMNERDPRHDPGKPFGLDC